MQTTRRPRRKFQSIFKLTSAVLAGRILKLNILGSIMFDIKPNIEYHNCSALHSSYKVPCEWMTCSLLQLIALNVNDPGGKYILSAKNTNLSLCRFMNCVYLD